MVYLGQYCLRKINQYTLSIKLKNEVDGFHCSTSVLLVFSLLSMDNWCCVNDEEMLVDEIAMSTCEWKRSSSGKGRVVSIA